MMSFLFSKFIRKCLLVFIMVMIYHGVAKTAPPPLPARIQTLASVTCNVRGACEDQLARCDATTLVYQVTQDKNPARAGKRQRAMGLAGDASHMRRARLLLGSCSTRLGDHTWEPSLACHPRE